MIGTNGAVVLGADGDLYGTTQYAGVSGLVYRLTIAGQESALYGFPGAAAGTHPFGGVIAGSAGNFYGTAGGGSENQGVLYELSAAGKPKVLYTFADGVGTGLARDAKGNLYGTAGNKATTNGEVFKVDTAGTYTVVYSFTGGSDGTGSSGVVLGPGGNLYGSSAIGASGNGLVFRLTTAGVFTILHTFSGGDGSQPNGGIVFDATGNLYGTTNEGGGGAGVIYKISTAGDFSVLYTFPGGADGGNPQAGVTVDGAGNLYGTAVNYGVTSQGDNAEGVVFELNAAGQYSVLYAFTGGADGGSPSSAVVRDSAGNLYGTTEAGGLPGCGVSGCGVVYEVSSSGQETVLHSFTGGADGASPQGAGLSLAINGNLVGTTPWGGKGGSAASEFSGAGTVFEIVLQ